MRGTKKKQTAWWTEELKTAVKHKMKMYRRWTKTRNAMDREIYVVARREAGKVKKKSKKLMWKKIGQDLEHDLRGTRKLLYSMAKNYRKGNNDRVYTINDKNNNLLVESGDIADRWMEYFCELLNIDIQHDEEPEDEEVEAEDETEAVDEEGYEITEMEVRMALDNMQNGKAAGDDELTAEVIKSLGVEGIRWLTVMMNVAYRVEAVPADWQKGIICPIYKNKGAKSDCNNHRGVTLLSHTGKVYERIIEISIRDGVEDKLGNWQYGFRPGRGTTDLVFVLKLLL